RARVRSPPSRRHGERHPRVRAPELDRDPEAGAGERIPARFQGSVEGETWSWRGRWAGRRRGAWAVVSWNECERGDRDGQDGGRTDRDAGEERHVESPPRAPQNPFLSSRSD